MGSVTNRTSLTKRGWVTLSPRNQKGTEYSLLQILHGSNPISQLEVVSSLNTLDLGAGMYYYSYATRTEKYNPKVYLGTIQTVTDNWNYDAQTGQENDLPTLQPGVEKSGSWP